MKYESRDKYADAEALSRRAVALLEKELGPGEPEDSGFSTALLTLGAINQHEGKCSDAEAIYQRAAETVW